LPEQFADKSKAGVAGSYELEVTNAGMRPVLTAAPRVMKRVSDETLLELLPTAIRYLKVHESMQAAMILNEHLVPSQFIAYQRFLVVLIGVMNQFDEADGWLSFLKLDRDLRTLQWEQALAWDTEDGHINRAMHANYLVTAVVASQHKKSGGASGSGLAAGRVPSAPAKGPGFCKFFAKASVCSKPGCAFRHACQTCGSEAHGTSQHNSAGAS
jgi:hypothetical protein